MMASSSSSMICLLLFLTISATLMQQTLGVKCYRCYNSPGKVIGGESRSSEVKSVQSLSDVFGEGGAKARDGTIYAVCKGKKESWATESCNGKCTIVHNTVEDKIARECSSPERLRTLSFDSKGCVVGSAKACKCKGASVTFVINRNNVPSGLRSKTFLGGGFLLGRCGNGVVMIFCLQLVMMMVAAWILDDKTNWQKWNYH